MNKDYYYDNYRLADFYDDLYTYDDDFALWKQFIKPNMRILEVACGTGRLTKLLLENCTHIHVDALDYAQEMLDILRSKMPFFQSDPTNSISIINADMRYYATDKKYDLIIIPSNSLNHIETNADMELTLSHMHSLLNEGGILTFDILNPAFEFLLREPDEVYDQEIHLKKNTGRFFHSEESSKYNYASQINSVVYTYYYCDKSGQRDENSPEYKMEINVRLYFPMEMDYFVTKSPFSSFIKYDWYDKRQFKGQTMEQIYVLQR